MFLVQKKMQGRLESKLKTFSFVRITLINLYTKTNLTPGPHMQLNRHRDLQREANFEPQPQTVIGEF